MLLGGVTLWVAGSNGRSLGHWDSTLKWSHWTLESSSSFPLNYEMSRLCFPHCDMQGWHTCKGTGTINRDLKTCPTVNRKEAFLSLSKFVSGICYSNRKLASGWRRKIPRCRWPKDQPIETGDWKKEESLCFEYSVTCTTGREFIDMVVRNPLKSKQSRQLFAL